VPNNGGILTNAKLEIVFARYQISFCSTALHDFWLKKHLMIPYPLWLLE